MSKLDIKFETDELADQFVDWLEQKGMRAFSYDNVGNPLNPNTMKVKGETVYMGRLEYKNDYETQAQGFVPNPNF